MLIDDGFKPAAKHAQLQRPSTCCVYNNDDDDDNRHMMPHTTCLWLILHSHISLPCTASEILLAAGVELHHAIKLE